MTETRVNFLRAPNVQVREWISAAGRGDKLTYHLGYLANDRTYNSELDEAAVRLWFEARKSRVQLTQVRVAEGCWAYVAMRK